MPYAFIGYSCTLEELKSELHSLKSKEERKSSNNYLIEMMKFALEVEAEVYWCDNEIETSKGDVCLPNDTSGLGHPHVFFYIDPPQLNQAMAKIKEFCPNMNCTKVGEELRDWMERKLTPVLTSGMMQEQLWFIGYKSTLDEIQQEYQAIQHGTSQTSSASSDQKLRNMLNFAMEVKASVYWCDNKVVRSKGTVCLSRDDSGLGHPHVCVKHGSTNQQLVDDAMKKYMPNMNYEIIDWDCLAWMRDEEKSQLTRIIDY